MQVNTSKIEESLGSAPKPSEKKERNELVNQCWYVENYHGKQDVSVDVKAISERVFIERCCESLIQVKAKSNAVFISNCAKSVIVVPDVIASVDLVNCHDVRVQLTGTCGTLSVDKCEEISIEMASKASKKCHIHSSTRCSNIRIVCGCDGGKEYLLPNLLSTCYCDKTSKFVTSICDKDCGASSEMN